MQLLRLAVVILSGVTLGACQILSRVDQAMEIDSLKDHIRVQKDEILFLQDVMNEMFSKCSVSVADFENHIKSSGRILNWDSGRIMKWNNNEALVGPYKVVRNGACIQRIVVVGI